MFLEPGQLPPQEVRVLPQLGEVVLRRLDDGLEA